MKKFPKFNIEAKLVNANQYMATAVISPLSRGFGNTLGNSLRRILLGFIPGAAVFAVKINSLSHEFDAVDGVMEDVARIILNIKKLVIQVDEKVFGLEELQEKTISNWPTLKIERDKKGVVYAKDVVCPPGAKIINGDMKICELTDDVPLNIEMFVNVDIGYKSFAENKERLNTLKIIAIDSMFSPVVKVDWKVTEEKTTKDGTTDKLTLTVATNGSIKAVDALALAAQTLISFLTPIAEFDPAILKKSLISEEEVVTKKISMSDPIENLDLTMRSLKCLQNNGINTIPELTNLTKEELKKFKNLGQKSMNEILDKLQEKGFKLREG